MFECVKLMYDTFVLFFWTRYIQKFGLLLWVGLGRYRRRQRYLILRCQRPIDTDTDTDTGSDVIAVGLRSQYSGYSSLVRRKLIVKNM